MSAEELPNAGAPRPERHTADTRPQDLTFSSVSRDGHRMIFVDDAGHEFSVQIDLGGPGINLGAGSAEPPAAAPEPAPVVEPVARVVASNEPAIALRPREIQDRIRAGESPEAVAAAAGTTVEKIKGFADPVMAERAHMAELAQRASIRRPAAEASAARILADAITPLLDAHELGKNVDEAVRWDSSRRYDGRWNVTADFEIGPRSGRAEFVFDAKGKYVTLQNDEARWLVGDVVEAPVASVPVTETSRQRDELFAARQRRMAAAIEPLTAHEAEVVEVTLVEAAVAVETVTAEMPVEAFLEQADKQSEPIAEIAETDIEASKPAKKKRTSVPSWDEIMFGGAK